MWVRCNKIHHKLTTQSAPHQNHHNHKHPEEGQKYLIHNINHRLSIPKPRNFQYISLLDGFSWELISLSQPSHQDPSWKWFSHPKIEEKWKEKSKVIIKKNTLGLCNFFSGKSPLTDFRRPNLTRRGPKEDFRDAKGRLNKEHIYHLIIICALPPCSLSWMDIPNMY